jgi:hypothetical protein
MPVALNALLVAVAFHHAKGLWRHYFGEKNPSRLEMAMTLDEVIDAYNADKGIGMELPKKQRVIQQFEGAVRRSLRIANKREQQSDMSKSTDRNRFTPSRSTPSRSTRSKTRMGGSKRSKSKRSKGKKSKRV